MCTTDSKTPLPTQLCYTPLQCRCHHTSRALYAPVHPSGPSPPCYPRQKKGYRKSLLVCFACPRPSFPNGISESVPVDRVWTGIDFARRPAAFMRREELVEARDGARLVDTRRAAAEKLHRNVIRVCRENGLRNSRWLCHCGADCAFDTPVACAMSVGCKVGGLLRL